MNMTWIDKVVRWDYQVLSYFNSIIGQDPRLDFLFKFLAVGLIYLIPFILVVGYFWSKEAKKVMIMTALGGLAAWRIVGKIASAFYFRERPFSNAIIDLKEIIFHRPTYSFPSDHGLFLAAVFMIFWLYGYRKLAIFTGLMGIIISLMRIVVGLHYPLDILAGWLLGLGAAGAIFWQRRFLEKYIAQPVEKLIYRVIKR